MTKISIYSFLPSSSKQFHAKPKSDNLQKITTTSTGSRIETRPIYVTDIPSADENEFSVRKLAKSVVKIASLKGERLVNGTGSVIDVNEDKTLVLTSKHVIRMIQEGKDASITTITLLNYNDSLLPSTKEVVPSRVILYKKGDLCLIEIDNCQFDGDNPSALAIADSDIEKDSVIHLMGYGMTKDCKFSSGVVYSVPCNKEQFFEEEFKNIGELSIKQRYDFIVNSTANAAVHCESGDSGGPILNNLGELVGVTTTATSQTFVKWFFMPLGTFNFALSSKVPSMVPRGDCNFINVSVAKRFLEDYAKGTNIEEAYI